MQAAWCRFVSGLVVPFLLATSAHAEEAAAPPAVASASPDCPEQDATVCGRRHFEAGTQAFEKGNFTEAAAAFERALSERPHPVIRFNLGLTLARLGRPTAAIEQLTLVQQDPAADKELRVRAEREQRSASQALARITFRLSDPTRERVELDGTAVRLAGADELSLDPGAHHVRVISGSSVVLDQDLELAPSERVELRVGERSRSIDGVVVPPVARSTPPEHKAPPPAPPPPPPSHKLAPAWFYAGAAVTVGLTGVTVWSGLDTKHAYSAYERDLPTLSQSQADARVSRGHGLELRTNLLLAGSLLCGAGTAVLGVWFVDFGHEQQTSVGFTSGSVTVSGRF